MEASDKIYISPNIENRTWLIGKADTVNIEYICKDALLKWIQEAISIPHENAITRDLAFQEIVNKLNSM